MKSGVIRRVASVYMTVGFAYIFIVVTVFELFDGDICAS